MSDYTKEYGDKHFETTEEDALRLKNFKLEAKLERVRGELAKVTSSYKTLMADSTNYINELSACCEAKEKAERRIAAPIICLCGSTRFTEQMLIKQWELTKAGNIVLSWCALPDSYFQTENRFHIGDQEGVKEIVDEVHKRKIDLSDEVYVLNIEGYIGESTTSEVKYALDNKKPVKWHEPNYMPEWARG